MTAPIRVATRGSALARWQAEHVVARLGVPAELVIVTTTGDRDRTSAIHALGGNGVFVKEVQEAVRRGDADVAVHSAKDLPAVTPEDLVIGAVPERADARDALVGSALAALPERATVGTGSVRRRAQLAAVRPDLRFAELRGNVPTRVEKAAQFDAVVIAYAALERLALADRAAEVVPVSVMLPMVGQGALAVECRADDVATRRSPRVHRRRRGPPRARRRTRIPRRARRRVHDALRGVRDLDRHDGDDRRVARVDRRHARAPSHRDRHRSRQRRTRRRPRRSSTSSAAPSCSPPRRDPRDPVPPPGFARAIRDGTVAYCA